MNESDKNKPQGLGPAAQTPPAADTAAEPDKAGKDKPEEIGGPSGPEPTRYGDWERKGRCVDF